MVLEAQAKVLVVTVVFGFGSLGFFPQTGSLQTAKAPSHEDQDGYAVLSVLLDRKDAREANSLIEIGPLTVSEKGMLSRLSSCDKIPEEFESVVSDFHEKNKSSLRLMEKFSMESKYELPANPEHYLPPPTPPSEQELRDRNYTRPVFVVSAVGFDKTKTHAIAYISAFCGGQCGGGAYRFLTKEKEGWKEIKGAPKCEWTAQDRKAADCRKSS